MRNMVSIIVPIYNAEKYIEKCLHSLMRQTYRNIELILVNDGSTDNSQTIIEEYAQKDARILVVNQENNGVSKARNKGLKCATGDWILFVDIDDYVELNYCEKLVEKAILKRLDVVISKGHRQKTEYDEQMHLLSKDEIDQLKCACIAFDENKFLYNIDAPWGKLFNARCIKDNNILFPENISRSEDTVFCATVYEFSKKILFYDWAGYNHIENQESLCRKYNSNAVEELVDILNEKSKWVKRFHDAEDRYIKALAYRALPGINECENVYFLHSDNRESIFLKLVNYQKMLKIKEIRENIRKLKKEDVEYFPYRRRLLLYKINLGWILILKKVCKHI